MMISPAGASPYAAAAALDRQFRQDARAPADDAAGTPTDGGPDVVVTLGQGAAASSTYDATGRLAGASTASSPDDVDDDDGGNDDATETADANDALAA